jgi:hypothetical protein
LGRADVQLALARGQRWLAVLESGEARFLKENRPT